MDKELYGHSEAIRRIEQEAHRENHPGIEYPRATNERGEMGGRHMNERHEHHSNHSRHKREHHAHGDSVGSSIGEGGSHMAPHFGAPEGGRQDNHWRRNAIQQARAENHKHGGHVGRRHHEEGDEVTMRRGGRMHKERHAMGDMVGNGQIGQRIGQRISQNMQNRMQNEPRAGMANPRSNVMQPQQQPQDDGSGQYRRGGRVKREHHSWGSFVGGIRRAGVNMSNGIRHAADVVGNGVRGTADNVKNGAQNLGNQIAAPFHKKGGRVRHHRYED